MLAACFCINCCVIKGTGQHALWKWKETSYNYQCNQVYITTGQMLPQFQTYSVERIRKLYWCQPLQENPNGFRCDCGRLQLSLLCLNAFILYKSCTEKAKEEYHTVTDWFKSLSLWSDIWLFVTELSSERLFVHCLNPSQSGGDSINNQSLRHRAAGLARW